VDDAVLDRDIGRRHFGPSLRLQLGEQFLADRAVVGFGFARLLVDGHRERAHQVRSAHDPDKLAVANDRRSLDPVCLEQYGDVGDRSRVGDRDDVARHDVLHFTAVRPDVVAGEFVRRRHHVEPPRSATLGSGFGAVQEIAFADHSNHPVFTVDDRNRADPAFRQELCDLLDRCLLVDRDYLAGHYIHRAHRRALIPLQHHQAAERTGLH
jgi:hypothetical protein